MLGAAYELLDERTADRLEEELFRGVQTAFGRAQRTHAAFAARYSLQGRTFEQPSAGLPSQGARAFLERAGEAIDEADTLLAELQDSMLPGRGRRPRAARGPGGDPHARGRVAGSRAAVRAHASGAEREKRTDTVRFPPHTVYSPVSYLNEIASRTRKLTMPPSPTVTS